MSVAAHTCACECGTVITGGRFARGHYVGGNRLTQDQIKFIVEQHADRNRSFESIAEELGITSQTVRRRLRQAGFSTERKPAYTFDDMPKQSRAELKRKYGITIEDWRDMFLTQGGKCALCRAERCQTGRRFAVDHDHETGRVRGLICLRCNAFVAAIEAEPERLSRVLDYLNINTGDQAEVAS